MFEAKRKQRLKYFFATLLATFSISSVNCDCGEGESLPTCGRYFAQNVVDGGFYNPLALCRCNGKTITIQRFLELEGSCSEDQGGTGGGTAGESGFTTDLPADDSASSTGGGTDMADETGSASTSGDTGSSGTGVTSGGTSSSGEATDSADDGSSS